VTATSREAARVLAAPRRGPIAAAVRLGPVLLFAVAPAVVVVTMFVVAVTGFPLAWDFRNELYPQAKEILAGDNPYPEALWPPLAALVAMPFTVLRSEAAGVAFAALGLVCIALALWLVGVRDWRVFGVVALWPPVLADIRIAHLTPMLCLLTALVWRYRDRPLVSGVALGAAGGLKFFLWPLGVWLLATRRYRAAVVAAVGAIASILPIALLTSLTDYVETLRMVSERFDQDGYSSYGFLTQLGVDATAAQVVTYAAGAALLLATWLRRSFVLAVAAALVLSPIVWLDFYALAAIPLAVARPTFSPIWLVPLVTWGLPSSGIATDAVWGVGRVLAVFSLVFAIAFRIRADSDGRAPIEAGVTSVVVERGSANLTRSA
jgi:Glycosyltransferase family 87